MVEESTPPQLPMFVVNTTAFIWHQGRYLMIVRAATKEVAPGALTPPGGKLEVPSFAAGPDHDMLEDNVRREVREEVGVEVNRCSSFPASASLPDSFSQTTSIPMLRAVPSMMRQAASRS